MGCCGCRCLVVVSNFVINNDLSYDNIESYINVNAVWV